MADRILILGSNSFSGSHFAAHAMHNGHDVIGVSRSPEYDPVFLPYANATAGSFRFHQLDLNHELDAIIQVINAERPAYIVNFAAQGMVAESWDSPDQWFQTNLVSAVKLHDALRSCAFLRRFVQISTPEVYGSCPDPVSEETALNPTTPYAVSKAACDMSLTTYFSRYGFPAVFTRAANVYGPGQQLYRIIPKTILAILAGDRIPLHGGGRALRSFIFIEDVAVATYAVMTRGINGNAYHVSTDRMVSIRQLVDMICKAMEVDPANHVEMVADRPGKDMAYALDSSRIRDELGWRDTVDLESGLQRTIAWAAKNVETLTRFPAHYEHKP